MSWREYVQRHVSGQSQVSIAEKVGVSQTAVSRWLRGAQGVDAAQAIKFARAVGDEPLSALVAAGFLTTQEARQRAAALAPDLSAVSNEDLVRLVAQRLGAVQVRQEDYAPAARKGNRQRTPADELDTVGEEPQD